MTEDEFAELSAGHALHALSTEDEARFAEALAENPEWAAGVRSDAATVAALAEGFAPVAPPLLLRSSLLARIAQTPQTGDVDSIDVDEDADAAAALFAIPYDDASDEPVAAGDAPPTTTAIQTVERRNWTRGLLALAASFALLVGIGFGAGALNEYLTRPASIVALNDIQAASDAQAASITLDNGLSATAHWSDELGKAVLVSENLPELASDQDFELWFVRGDEAIPAGVFEADGTSGATALLDGAFQAGDTIAVTVEPAGGSPDGTPSGAPIVAVPTA